ncbi:hypothetical protein DL769_001241 [Monosporascus sp. CRB-8-3]|nr:hypothetical protein DL769_001241 [Monosporascus sp. CRB-8-3]
MTRQLDRRGDFRELDDLSDPEFNELYLDAMSGARDPTDIDLDFYGDEQPVNGLNAQVSSFDVANCWKETGSLPATPPNSTPTKARQASPSPAQQQVGGLDPPSPAAPLPALRIKNEEPSIPDSNPNHVEQPALHNPYAGVLYAWQLSESVDSFLARLPPSITPQTKSRRWIFICNPYVKQTFAPKEPAPSNKVRGCEDEAPQPAEGMDLPTFLQGGMERLHILSNFIEGAEDANLPPSRKSLEIRNERTRAGRDILHLWMLFPTAEKVDQVWCLVAMATAKGELGIAAKVEPRPIPTVPGPVKKGRLICIYTYDFRDKGDIKRVLSKMRDLGLVAAPGDGKRCWYKTDLALAHRTAQNVDSYRMQLPGGVDGRVVDMLSEDFEADGRDSDASVVAMWIHSFEAAMPADSGHSVGDELLGSPKHTESLKIHSVVENP